MYNNKTQTLICLLLIMFWRCPVDRCTFTTTSPRMCGPHLLRVHGLLFQSHGRDPLPLSAEELQQRLAALRHRQRGSRERRRDALRAQSSALGGKGTAQSHPGPVAGAPTAAACMSSSTVDPMTFGTEPSHLSFEIEEGFLTNVPMDDGWLGDATPPLPSEQVPGSSGTGVSSSVSEMVDDLLTSAPTEDWEDSFRDLLQFHDDGSPTFDAVLQSTEVIPRVPPAQPEQPTMPLPGGLTMMELCRTV